MEEKQQVTKVKIVYDYVLLELLGKSAFSETYLAKKKNDKQFFAAKVLPKSNVNETEKNRHYFDAEIEILKKLSGHPNIIKFYEIKETKNNYFIINELANGGGLIGILQKYKEKNGKPFDEEIVQHLMKQICDAIRYIHEKGIIHRDLKLENILVNFPNPADKENMNLLGAQIKIFDFGVSIDLSQGKDDVSCSETPVNQVPTELEKYLGIDKGKTYDNKVDIWSLGTICYELLINHLPFDGANMGEFIQKVEKGISSVPFSISVEAMNFIMAMLEQDEAKRKSANDLLSMPFLAKSVR